MKLTKDGAVISGATILIALLIIGVSLTGLLATNFYVKETLNWQIQSLGQDMINLFVIVPVLVTTGIISSTNNKIAALLWAGTILYIIYTFIIYCFDIHFNKLFPVYCLVLCLSFYSFLWFIYKQLKKPVAIQSNTNSVLKVTGIYFITLSALFYFLWLSEIVPAIIRNTTPENLELSGLATNPVHVIDLSVFLPGIFITGLLLLRKSPLGPVIAIIILTFFILMDITIGWLAVLLKQKGLQTDLTVTIVMAGLGLISLAILIWNLKYFTANYPQKN